MATKESNVILYNGILFILDNCIFKDNMFIPDNTHITSSAI